MDVDIGNMRKPYRGADDTFEVTDLVRKEIWLILNKTYPISKFTGNHQIFVLIMSLHLSFLLFQIRALIPILCKMAQLGFFLTTFCCGWGMNPRLVSRVAPQPGTF